jgi:hypothetical protein
VVARDKYLSIYLNDHLAALTALRDVARRSRRSNDGSALGEYLEDVAVELEESRGMLRRVMHDLRIRRDPFKVAAAWAAEKVGRLKLNGHLVRYSPLSRVLELEGLILGAEIEARTWEAVGPHVSEDAATLVDRCERRRDELVRHHRIAARAALGG